MCHHTCYNTVGSFLCTCRPGFRLQADRVSCEGEPWAPPFLQLLSCLLSTGARSTELMLLAPNPTLQSLVLPCGTRPHPSPQAPSTPNFFFNPPFSHFFLVISNTPTSFLTFPVPLHFKNVFPKNVYAYEYFACLDVCAWRLWRSEEVVGYPRIGVTAPCGCWEPNRVLCNRNKCS